MSRLEGVNRGDASEQGASSSTMERPILSTSTQEYARLPCFILPTIRTSRFFDRKDIVDRIDQFFQTKDSTQTFSSLAIHGLGGVGKSSIALNFAELKLRRNELDALFWIHSEKAITISQSFSDIAVRLKLPHAQPGDHEENLVLLHNWLQTTTCRWMIIYDNAEDPALLRSYWPAAGRGQALITTRNHGFAFEPADGGIEVKTWDPETGSKFLIHLLSTNIGQQLKDDEAASAYELAKRLSGHALAISHMAGLIHRRAWTIAELVEMYNQHLSEMHGISGNSSINALWDFAFRSLDANRKAILGVLSFVEPDNIPESLFEASSAADVPHALAFCANTLRFSEAIEDLITLALIKRDKTERTLSLHRLVQTSFKYFLTPEERQESFNHAASLVSRVFPRRNTAVAQLYRMWEKCNLWTPHVLSLRDCFREEQKANPKFTTIPTYCDLNNACQRYLLEVSGYTELQDLIDINTAALETLPEAERVVAIMGSLKSHKGQVLTRLGKTQEGVVELERSYKIRGDDDPFNPQESAWAAGNAANAMATMNDFDRAITWQEQARDHWLDWSNQEEDEEVKGKWPAVIKLDLAIILSWAGQQDQARKLARDALMQIECTQPFNWAIAAYTHFALGTLNRREGKFSEAEADFMEAQNAWSQGDQLRTAPFNAACIYRMGCTALDQGKLEAAVKHFRDAKVMTETRQTTMIPEHARVLFKLSEALEQEPRHQEEATRLRLESEILLKQRDPGIGEASNEAVFDSHIYILWR